MCDGVLDGEDADHLDQPAAERSLANPLHGSTSEAVATRHDGGNDEPPLPQAGHTQRTPDWDDACCTHIVVYCTRPSGSRLTIWAPAGSRQSHRAGRRRMVCQ